MIYNVYAIFRILCDFVFCSISLLKIKQFDKKGKTKEKEDYVVSHVQWWGKQIYSYCKTPVEIYGLENIPKDGSVTIIGNHQSYMDIPLILGYVNKQVSFMAKKELSHIPLLSTWMKSMKCTFIDRKDLRQSIKAMEQSVQTVKNGSSQVIFPEGTRSKDPNHAMGEFKKGSFKLAFRAGVPILPVTIDGSWHLLDKKIGFKNAKVKFYIHPIVETAGLTKEQQGEIPQIVYDIVNKALPK